MYSRVIDTAASQLTKTAITVTAIFIVALGYDSWYYLFGYSGVIEYTFNTPVQIIGQCCCKTVNLLCLVFKSSHASIS